MADRKGGDQRTRRMAAMGVAENLLVVTQIGDMRCPWFLRNDQHADTKLGHDGRRTRRDRRRIDAVVKTVVGCGANVDFRLLDVLPVELHIALLKTGEYRLRGFNHALARFAHVDVEALELDTRQPPSEAEQGAPAGHRIQHGHILGNPYRRIPGQYHHHRPDLYVRAVAGHIGQELGDIGGQHVVGEVVLAGPHRLKA